MIDARTNRNLWGEQYDRSFSDVLGGPAGHYQRDLCETEGKIVRRKCEAVGVERWHERSGGLPALSKGAVLLAEAHTDSLEKSKEFFNQAIEKDPNYAVAYVGLAEYYYVVADYAPIPAAIQTPKARAAAQKALAIDDSLAEAHAVLGGASQDLWEWDAAEREYRRLSTRSK